MQYVICFRRKDSNIISIILVYWHFHPQIRRQKPKKYFFLEFNTLTLLDNIHHNLIELAITHLSSLAGYITVWFWLVKKTTILQKEHIVILRGQIKRHFLQYMTTSYSLSSTIISLRYFKGTDFKLLSICIVACPTQSNILKSFFWHCKLSIGTRLK